MDKTAVLFAKFAGLKKNFDSIPWDSGFRTSGSIVEHLLLQFDNCRKELIKTIPELYSDLPLVKIPDSMGIGMKGDTFYGISQIDPIIQNIDYILEVRTSFRIGENLEEKDKPKRIFISHGLSKEWFKVQSYIEKDMHLLTLELAQEANLGRTILQKLNEESSKCCYAVIVMTGDDIFGQEIRARENVLHEVGFFQGKYGLKNVVLLHEEDVNIPSNIHGLVYIPFPKNYLEATFGALSRELKMIFN